MIAHSDHVQSFISKCKSKYTLFGALFNSLMYGPRQYLHDLTCQARATNQTMLQTWFGTVLNFSWFVMK